MSQGVNPNVEVGQSAVQVDTGGSVSFNDMLSISEASGSSPKKEAAPTKAAPKKEEAAPTAEKAADPKKQEAAEPVSAKEAAKILKAMAGEASLDVPSDALFEVIVDGKPVQATAQDLINNYSGKTAWDKKFTEIDKERKAFQSERQELEDTVTQFFTNAGDPNAPWTSSIGFIAERAGQNPIEFIRAFREKMVADVQKYAEMTPEQRRAFDAEEENQYFRTKLKSEDDKRRYSQELENLRQRTSQIRETYGIDENTFKQTYEEIVQSGKVGPEQYDDPEYVAQWYQVSRNFNRVDGVLDGIDPELKANEEVVRTLVSVLSSDPSMSDERLVTIAEGLSGKSKKKGGAAKALSDRVRANEGRPTGESSNAKNPSSDPISFDEI